MTCALRLSPLLLLAAAQQQIVFHIACPKAKLVNGALGCNNAGSVRCNNVGNLTDADFSYSGADYTISVVNGPLASSSAPASVQVGQAAGRDAVTDVTEYVVQVIVVGGSYPDQPINYAPDGVALGFRPAFPTQVVDVLAIDRHYEARVAARNGDGVGPWSAEVSFTVRIG